MGGGNIIVMIDLIHNVLGFISETSFFDGLIALDVVMHLTISYALMIYLLYKKTKFSYAFIVVVFLSLLKEFFDSFSLTSTMSESIKDFLVSMIFPLILMVVHKIKRGK